MGRKSNPGGQWRCGGCGMQFATKATAVRHVWNVHRCPFAWYAAEVKTIWPAWSQDVPEHMLPLGDKRQIVSHQVV